MFDGPGSLHPDTETEDNENRSLDGFSDQEDTTSAADENESMKAVHEATKGSPLLFRSTPPAPTSSSQKLPESPRANQDVSIETPKAKVRKSRTSPDPKRGLHTIDEAHSCWWWFEHIKTSQLGQLLDEALTAEPHDLRVSCMYRAAV